MLVIVGHGPSAMTVDGPWLDNQTVVRLKDPYGKSNQYMRNRGITPGMRTDVMMGRDLSWRNGYEDHEFWYFPRLQKFSKQYLPKNVRQATFHKWDKLWVKHNDHPKKKPSTGMCAIFCAAEFGYDEVGLIGFDSFFNDSFEFGINWYHDGKLEKKVAETFIKIVNCTPDNTQYTSRIGSLG